MVVFFALQVPNEPGVLGDIASRLHDAGVNIEAFAADRSGIRVLSSDPEKARACFDAAQWAYEDEEVIEIELPNQPGQLARLAKALGNHKVNIVTSFGSASSGAEKGKIFIGVDQVDAAWDALESLTPTAE